MRNTMRFTIVALVIACTAFIHVANAKEKPLKVFICAGQSNMVGSRSIESKLPKKLQGAQKNIFFNDAVNNSLETQIYGMK